MRDSALPGPPGPKLDRQSLTFQGLVQVVQVVQVKNEIDREQKNRRIDIHSGHACISRVKRIHRLYPDHLDRPDRALYFNGLLGPSAEERLDRAGPDILWLPPSVPAITHRRLLRMWL